MHNAFIYGTYQFIGFHLCTALLNNGWEVKGIDYSNEFNPFTEEKRLEVGRNANFQELSSGEKEWIPASERPFAVIVSLFDFFMERNEEQVLNDRALKTFLEENFLKESGKNLLVLLLPIQFLADSSHSGNGDLNSFLENLNRIKKNVLTLYLPSVYGPWQPSSFFSHYAILNGQKIDYAGSREWRGDLLYIEDALSLILKQLETGTVGAYLLESGVRNYWKNCMEELGVEIRRLEDDQSEIQLNSKDIKRLQIKNPTTFLEARKKQKEHWAHIDIGSM